MSIARTAPAKFELQDFVCIELVLRFGQQAVERFVVEPKGGEDGSLFTSGPAPLHYEVQGKGAAGQVTVAEMAKWLTHFPERTDRGMLLERLAGDPARRLVIVASGRVADALDPLVAPADWRGEALAPPPAALAQKLLDAFRASPIEGQAAKDLGDRRRKHHEAIGAALTRRVVADVLRRVVVIERATTPTVRDWIGRHLRASGVPGDSIDDAVNRLKALVTIRRGGNDDLAAPLFAQVGREAPTTVRPLDYLPDGQEADWGRILRARHALLLSGVTRSGKSLAARWVAADLETQGFRVDVFGRAEDAERFLLDPAEGGRVAILDDPLGGAHGATDPDRQLHRLETLLKRLSPRRRLIVAQGRERLFEATAAVDLASLSLDGHTWCDLGARSPGFLADLWLHLADRAGVADPLRSGMANLVRAGGVELEPGRLAYLANLPKVARDALTVEAAVSAASVDAMTLFRALRDEAAAKDLLPALAIASEPRAPALGTEIAFVAGDGGDRLPSRTDHIGTMLVIGGPTRPPAPMPDYETAPVLDAASVEDLDRLEGRVIVSTDAMRRSGFTHPFYRAAAECYFRNPASGLWDRLLGMHGRALFARELSTARAAARSLDWMLQLAGGRPGVTAALANRAEDGLRSLFPAVRDICFDFLLRHTVRFDASIGERLPQAARLVASTDLSSLQWMNGEAIFPPDGRIPADAVMRGMLGPDQTEVAAVLGPLERAGGSALAPEAAGEAVLYFRRRPDEMAHGHIANLLAYDEAVIRAEATRAWLGRPRDGDAETLARIFSDTHPLVARRALGGGIAGYNASGPDRRREIIDGLAGMASSPANAAILLERLVLFDRDHIVEGEKPWPIFAALMPIVLEALPTASSFIEARLHNAMIEAGPVLSAEDLARICERWVGWIERMDRAGRWLDDFALDVTDILFRSLGDRPDLRGDMVPRLLSLRLTTSLLTVIKDAVDVWPDMTEVERKALMDVVTADPVDKRWRRAAALVREEVPREIQDALLGPDTSLDDGVEAVRAALGEDLFAACVGMQAGDPDMLGEWRSASSSPVWAEALGAAVTNPADPLFHAAFSRAAFASRRDDANFLRTLRAAASVDPEQVFEELVERSVYDGGLKYAEHWSALLAIGPRGGDRSAWFDRMAEVAPEIINNVTALDTWILDAAHRAEVGERLKVDEVALGMLAMILEWRKVSGSIEAYEREHSDSVDADAEEVDSDAVQAKLVASLVKLMELRAPRFLDTLDTVARVLKREKLLSESDEKRLDTLREEMLPAASAARDRYTAIEHSRRPTDWVTA